ncbi:pilus assembly FimT family protein [Vibrio hippocampi]|uniref:MSHA biogenesis protein MshA n=1 Tax=Vibrio hippocampi TaxID=654686 RepID=A0ABM8ZH69_9VIBR|nr:type II secretion system protein [Vibrio hippocampi]CAH0525724.1 hypothetical protein VHP8226_01254 [Vibrio hippocampi]
MVNDKNRGFTLIEMIVVITILGILAVIAAPRFLNYSSDARASAVEGLKGALVSGASLVHAKSVIQDVDSGTDYVDFNDDGVDDINVRSGYPRVAASCNNFVAELSVWLNMTIDASCEQNADAEWYGVTEQNMFHFMPQGYTATSQNCYVTYTTASKNEGNGWEDTDSAEIVMDTSGC